MENCIFCKIAKGEVPSYRVFEDEHTFAFFDMNPASEYHTLVIPKKHYENMFDIPTEEADYVMRTIKKIVSLYHDKLGLTDVQVINNSGKAAQQSVFHLHYHIIPRKADDGQDIYLAHHPEWRENFPALLDRLK